MSREKSLPGGFKVLRAFPPAAEPASECPCLCSCRSALRASLCARSFLALASSGYGISETFPRGPRRKSSTEIKEFYRQSKDFFRENSPLRELATEGRKLPRPIARKKHGNKGYPLALKGKNTVRTARFPSGDKPDVRCELPGGPLKIMDMKRREPDLKPLAEALRAPRPRRDLRLAALSDVRRTERPGEEIASASSELGGKGFSLWSRSNQTSN